MRNKYAATYATFEKLKMRKIDINRREVRNAIRISNRNLNALKFGANETDNHIQMKLEICKWLKRQSKSFYTEAIFSDGSGRADVINADEKIIYEIYESETLESLEMKSKKYPFEVRYVGANQKFKEELIL